MGAARARRGRLSQAFGRANGAAFRILQAGARVLCAPYFRLTLHGAEHVPAGPFVIAPNHASLLDPFLLQVAMSRRLVYLMTVDWYDRPLLRPFFRFVKAIPVAEERGTNRVALARARATLLAGVPVGIFPEGRLSADGRLQAFSPGVASLALHASVPIVPAAIRGTHAALPRGSAVPRPRRVTIALGAPLSPPADAMVGNGRDRRRLVDETTERLRTSVAELLALRQIE